LIFLPLFTALWFVLPNLFFFIFGVKWVVAGEYAQILLPLLYLKFIGNLFTTTTYLYYEKQMENLMLGILIYILSISALLLGGIMGNIILGLTMMVLFNSIVIFYKLFRSYKFVKGDNNSVENT
jgi:O-antigen/teichoic acid export membrane protein